jgi:glycosyltransferase involved in cell wall biosynthesis
MVSILIPVYNREGLIEETVQSAINQTYKDIEIIIVDNKSTDTTWDVLTRLATEDDRIRIFQNTENIGPVKNWMRCINEASGEYGKILWSDDLISPTFIEKTLPYLEKNDDVGFVFTGAEIFYDSSTKKIDTHFIGKTGFYKSESFILGILSNKGYPVSPGCAIFRLKDLSKNLLIDIPNKVGSSFSMHAIGNDLLIFLLTANAYDKFGFINKKLSYFRAHAGSISIKSNDGKLPLHYNLSIAYFVENFRNNLIEKLNTNIFFTIKRFPKGSIKYRLNSIEAYYINNKNYHMDLLHLIKKFFLIKRIVKFFF